MPRFLGIWAYNDDVGGGPLLSQVITTGDGNLWRIRVGTFVQNASDTANCAPITLGITSL